MFVGFLMHDPGDFGAVTDRVAAETIRLKTEEPLRQVGSDPRDLFAIFR
jgi:hypothetical protein